MVTTISPGIASRLDDFHYDLRDRVIIG